MNCKHKKYKVIKSKKVWINLNDYVIEETRKCIDCGVIFKEQIL